MRLIPFLIASFLLINPLLAWIFRKLEVQTEKLQFWVMVTSGAAWVIAVVFFIFSPKMELAQPAAEPGILPALVFSLDWISGALVLCAAALIFVTVLTRQENPPANAWLAGIGGACLIGLGSDSAYALGLTWTIIEGIHFYFFYRDRQITSNPRKYLPAVLLRLSAPGTLILLSLTQNEPGRSMLMTELDPQSGPLLILAGLFGFLGWFLSYRGDVNDLSSRSPGAAESWIPGLLGILLIVRGSAISEVGTGQLVIPLILSIILILSALASTLLDLTPETWFLSCGLMATLSAITSGAETALAWGVVMVLPGTRLWKGRVKPGTALIPLVLTLLGLLPFPYSPSWVGVSAFSAGIPGMILGLSYGVMLASALVAILKSQSPPETDAPSLPLLGVIGAAGVLISQYLISLRLGLVSTSQDLLQRPVVIWISILGMIPVLLLGNYLPLRNRKALGALRSRLTKVFWEILKAIVHFLDRLVNFISGIFEGQAGLIWAMLIGLLLITLITLGGV